MTSYRENEYQELCRRCRKPVVFKCRVCGAAFCAEHLEGMELCAECTARLASVERSGWLPPLAGTLLGFLGLLVGPGIGHITVYLGPLAGLGAGAAIGWWKRRRFLAAKRDAVVEGRISVATR